MMEHNWKIAHELRGSLTQNSYMSFTSQEGLLIHYCWWSDVCFKLKNVVGRTLYLLTVYFDVEA